MPTVSVLLPTYNRPKVLGRAIKSVIEQEFADWELIVVNDGGKNVHSVAAQFHDDRIRYVNKEHGDKSRALNHGIELARGKYIAYIDDDDRWYPNHLQVILAHLQLNPRCAGAYTDAVPVMVRARDRSYRATKPKHSRDFDHKILQRNFIPNLCVVHKKSVFRKTGLYDPDLKVLIDWDMMVRLYLVGFKLVHLPGITAEYYVKHNADNRIHETHKSSAIQSNRKLYSACHKRIKKRIQHYQSLGVDPYGCIPLQNDKVLSIDNL